MVRNRTIHGPGALTFRVKATWRHDTFHIGLEDVSEIIADLERGFAALHQAAA